MITTPSNSANRNYFRVLAVVFLVLGVLGVVLAHSAFISGLAMVPVIISAKLSQLSRRGPSPSRTSGGLARSRPGRGAWIVGILTLIFAGVAYRIMISPTIGGNEPWPVDLFAAAGILVAIVWTYLIAKSLL